MSTLNRLLQMVLRSKSDQFNRVLQEELRERAASLVEALYRKENKNILKNINVIELTEQVNPVISVKSEENYSISSLLQLRDGTTMELTETQIADISKLHKSLNTDNKERMIKLLSESQESVNRILNLARLNNRG
jgi:uncharacterized phage infection (PIP) family protein YhgE